MAKSRRLFPTRCWTPARDWNQPTEQRRKASPRTTRATCMERKLARGVSSDTKRNNLSGQFCRRFPETNAGQAKISPRSPLFSVSSVLRFEKLNTEDTEKRGERGELWARHNTVDSKVPAHVPRYHGKCAP